MSYYPLYPPADEAGKETLHAWWDNGFSTDEIVEIIKVGESQILTDAAVGMDEQTRINAGIRRSNVGWLQQSHLPWLYDRLGWIARKLNGQYFDLEVSGFQEDLQYTVYHSEVSGFYDWHMDKGYGSVGTAPRKLSMVMMLSHPDEYEGGDLELMVGSGVMIAAKTHGMVHAFPSYLMHRVTPVTKGTRRSLVVWLCGPKFR